MPAASAAMHEKHQADSLVDTGQIAVEHGAASRNSHLVHDSNLKRKCLRQFTFIPNTRALQRLDCARLVNVNDGVELLRQTRMKIMTQPLALRPIDHTNRALQARSA